MKLKIVAPAFITFAFFTTGCVPNIPVNGIIYSDVKHPGFGTGGIVNDSVQPIKEGSSICQSYAGLVALGDCTVEEAQRDSGITKVRSIEYESIVYPFYGKFTTVIKGE